MSAIDTYVFCLGGVLERGVASVTLDLLQPPVEKRMEVLDLAKALTLGRIDEKEYCVRAAAAAGAGISPGELEERITAGLRPAAGMDRLLAELAGRARLRLFCEVPPAWLAAARRNLPLLGRFQEADTLFSASLGLENTVQAVVEALLQAGWLAAGKTMWVDDNPYRVSAVVRRGVDAVIFVDERRLRRELGLRGLVEG